jgi:hypothetical protein
MEREFFANLEQWRRDRAPVLDREKMKSELRASNETIKMISSQRDKTIRILENLILTLGSSGAWIGFGCRSPFHNEEIIPRFFWHFLSINRERGTASSEEYGVHFAGVRCLPVSRLAEDDALLRALADDMHDAEERARQQALGTTDTTDRPTPAQPASAASDDVACGVDESLPTSGEVVMYSTGVAGRPSSRHLVEAEMERRARERQLCSRIGEEAQSLFRWLSKEHPKAPQMTPRTIENAIRERYYELRRQYSTTQE